MCVHIKLHLSTINRLIYKENVDITLRWRAQYKYPNLVKNIEQNPDYSARPSCRHLAHPVAKSAYLFIQFYSVELDEYLVFSGSLGTKKGKLSATPNFQHVSTYARLFHDAMGNKLPPFSESFFRKYKC